MDQIKLDFYKQIEESRNSKLLVYFTGDRPGWEAQIANDVVDLFAEHLDLIGVVPKISLLMYTNGGNTLAGWNIVNLIRQFCDDFEILIPSNCRSAGTLMCLGANRIVMTKQATLGPIDPSVNTALNPEIPGAGQMTRMPVSVEAIKGFLELAKNELLIKDDKSLAMIFNVLAEKVHPLVLGEVYRAIGQIQMLAKKLLVNQVSDVDKVNKIISFLCSESGSHDYTINRREAAKELGLNIEKPSQDFYDIIKKVYDLLREELLIRTPFDPNSYIGSPNNRAYNFKRVLLESISGGTDAFVSEGILQRIQQQGNIGIQDQRLFEGWKHYE